MAVGVSTRSDALGAGSILGKYELLKRLAFGGMAEIWLARAHGIQGFEKYVVLKRILPQYAENEKFVRMFLNEARLAATLDHPNIAQVHDIGHDHGAYFFVMEYLHGENLGNVMKTLVNTGRRMPLELAITIAVSAAAGLHYAHEKHGADGPLELVHRDVSPSNLVLTYSGAIKVVDFGIAKVSSASHEASKTNTPKGKASYMSPEQCRNEPLDRRSDVFALGIVLHEMTTMKRLFRADSELQILKLIEACIVTPPSAFLAGYPARLEQIVMRALRADPTERYPTALELQRDLEQFARDQRLPVSTAATAEFMEGVFGKKQEPWHGADMKTPPPGKSHRARTDPPRNRAPSLGDSLTRPILAESESRRRMWIPVIATAVVAVAAGVVAAIALMTKEAPAPQGPVVLVAEEGTISVEQPGGNAVGPVAPTVPIPAPVPVPVPSAPDPEPGSRPPSPRSVDPLSRAFSRKQAQIGDCFTTHAASLTGTPEIAIRFQISPQGTPTSVEVFPAELASTPLGACVAEIAMGTEFGPQREPVTFRIPLKVRRK